MTTSPKTMFAPRNSKAGVHQESDDADVVPLIASIKIGGSLATARACKLSSRGSRILERSLRMLVSSACKFDAQE